MVTVTNRIDILRFQNGFTIMEMAVVLVIMGLVLGGLIAPFSMQMEQRNLINTRATMETAKEALIGFAMTNGRLPCPADGNSNGRESFCTNATGACGAVLYTVQLHGRCSNPYNGFLPAATLGLSGTDNQGFLLDAYGGIAVNRIRYAVSDDDADGDSVYDFTAPSEMRDVTMASLQPNLHVCAEGDSINGTNCNTEVYLSGGPTMGVPVVIYSLGKNASSGGMDTDEAANSNPNSPNIDPVFVSHTPTPTEAPNGEFDDVVTWISSNILYSRMVQAGQLP